MNYNERKRLDTMSRIADRLNETLERHVLIRGRMKKNIMVAIADVGFVALGFLSILTGWVGVIGIILSLDVMWHVSKMIVKYNSINAALVTVDLIEAKKDRIFGPGEAEDKKREDAYILDRLRSALYDLIGLKSKNNTTERITLVCKMCICVVTGVLIGMVSTDRQIGGSSELHQYAVHAMVASSAIIGSAFGVVLFLFKDVKIESTVKTIDDCISSEL